MSCPRLHAEAHPQSRLALPPGLRVAPGCSLGWRTRVPGVRGQGRGGGTGVSAVGPPGVLSPPAALSLAASMNVALYAGIAGGVVAALIIIGVLVYCCCCRGEKGEGEETRP